LPAAVRLRMRLQRPFDGVRDMQTFAVAYGSRVPAALPMRGTTALSPHPEDNAPGGRRTFARGAEIFAEGDPCTVFYKVVSGTVRTVKLLSDVRRQIEAFHLPGDVFGLEGGHCHRFTAEAVDGVVLVAYRRSRVAELVRADPAFGEQLMASTLTSLDRATTMWCCLAARPRWRRSPAFCILRGACRAATASSCRCSEPTSPTISA